MNRTLALLFSLTALSFTLAGDRAAHADTKGGGVCKPSEDGLDGPAVDCGGGNGGNLDNPPPGWTLPRYSGSPPVLYRVYNHHNGDHLYSIDYNETNNAIWDYGYGSYEGIIGRCSGSQTSGTVPLWRFVSTWEGQHFYTSNVAEKNSLAVAGSGFNLEGVACYVYPSWQSNATCTMYRMVYGQNHFYTTDVGERAMVLANGGIDEGYVGFIACP